MARDTQTGKVYEKAMEQLTKESGHPDFAHVETQKSMGKKKCGTENLVDLYCVSKDGEVTIMSLKHQEVSGTAEQKVSYEFDTLVDILVSNPEVRRARIVLHGKDKITHGEGWTLREYYTNPNYIKNRFLPDSIDIKIMKHEDFMKEYDLDAHKFQSAIEKFSSKVESEPLPLV